MWPDFVHRRRRRGCRRRNDRAWDGLAFAWFLRPAECGQTPVLSEFSACWPLIFLAANRHPLCPAVLDGKLR